MVDITISNQYIYDVIPVNELTITETLDETLDSATITLPISLFNKEPYTPDSVVMVRTYSDSSFSNLETKYFILVTDTVKLVRRGDSQAYQHELVVAQYSRILSKHFVKNSVFSQPANNVHKVEYNSLYMGGSSWVQQRSSVVSSTTLPKEKLSKASLVLVCEAVKKLSNLNERTLIVSPQLDDLLITITEDGTTIYSNTYTYNAETTLSIPLTIFSNDGLSHVYNISVVWGGESGGETLDPDTYWNIIIHANLEFETYYYTLYDVLLTLRQREAISYANGNGDVINNRTADFNLPASGDFYNELISTISPNFTFTQKTLYECVAEVLTYLDGVPTLDGSTKILGIEYLNNNDTSNTISDSDIISIESNVAEEKYAEKVITLFQNAIPDNSKFYPSPNGFVSAKSTSFGVPENTDWVYELPEPIDEIISVELIANVVSKFDWASGTVHYLTTQVNKPIDITYYVLEKSEWDLLDTYNGTPTSTITRYKNNTIYYTKKGNTISVGNINDSVLSKYYNYDNLIKLAVCRYFGFSSYENDINLTRTLFADSKDISIRIKYRPSISGRLDVDSPIAKTSGEILVDQSNGSVDLKKLGQNMLGLAARIGEPEKTISTNIFTDFKNRPKKGSIYTDTSGNKWFANIVKTTMYPNCCVSEIQLSKNFNRLSQYIAIEQQKRFYEISNDLTETSESFITEYLVFAPYKTSFTVPSNHKCCFKKGFVGYFVTNMGYTDIGLDTSVSPMQFAIGNFGYNVNNPILCGTSNLMLGFVPYGAGNSIVYQMGFSQPKMAGKLTNYSGTINTKALYYTTNNGFFDFANIDIGGFIGQTDKGTYFKNAPDLSGTSVLTEMTSIIALRSAVFYKQPNEIFKIDYQVSLVGRQPNQVFFGEKLISKNVLVGGGTLSQSQIRIYISNNYHYSIIDKKCVGTIVSGYRPQYSFDSSTYNPSGSCVIINNDGEYTLPNDICSWAIGDSEGNLVIAFNIDLEAGDKLQFGYYGDFKR